MAGSRMPKGGIIPKDTAKEVIRELYEESAVAKRQKELEKYYAMELIYDDCRYCGEISEFQLHGPGVEEYTKNGKLWILSHCQQCNRVNWIRFGVKQEGDILHGFIYEPNVIVRRREDVIQEEQEVGPELSSPVPEKQQKSFGTIRVKLE